MKLRPALFVYNALWLPVALILALALVGCSKRSPNTDGSPGGSAGEEGGGGDTGEGGEEGGEAPGGEGGGSSALQCQELCTTTDDCLPSFECQDGRCSSQSDPIPGCTDDFACVALLSGWLIACEGNDGECPGQVCVEVDGEGRCATPPSEFLPCSTLQMEELEVPSFVAGAAGDPVVVCAKNEAKCDAGQCMVPCTADGCATTTPETPICNSNTGRCECDETSCKTNSSVCVQGQCRCATDADCTVGAVDACWDGVCGCTTAASCVDATKFHPGTTLVCEPWK